MWRRKVTGEQQNRANGQADRPKPSGF